MTQRGRFQMRHFFCGPISPMGCFCWYSCTAGHSDWGDNAPRLLRLPSGPLNGKLLLIRPRWGRNVRQTSAVLNGILQGAPLTPLHDAPQSECPAPATGNRCKVTQRGRFDMNPKSFVSNFWGSYHFPMRRFLLITLFLINII